MYDNNPENDEVEIDLLKIAQVLLHKIKFIIVITVLLAIATFGITYYFITPKYTATAMMYVNNTSFSVGNTSFSISSAELSAAQSLVDTYVVILKSRTTLEQIIEEDGLEYTYDQLYGMIESEAVNSTEIFSIDVTSTDPAEAERIANTITQVLPERISSIVDGSDVRIVDYAVIPSEKTSPSYTFNTVIGALVGLVLASVIVVLQYMFDDQIYDEDYLTQTYPDIPLLAVVPDMLSSEGKGYYYYSSSSGDNSKGKRKKKEEHTSHAEHAQSGNQHTSHQQAVSQRAGYPDSSQR